MMNDGFLQLIDYQLNMKLINNVSAIFSLESGDTMGERIGRIRQIQTDFLGYECPNFKQKIKKIRSYPPDPPNPFSHCITKSSCAKYSYLLFKNQIIYSFFPPFCLSNRYKNRAENHSIVATIHTKSELLAITQSHSHPNQDAMLRATSLVQGRAQR